MNPRRLDGVPPLGAVGPITEHHRSMNVTRYRRKIVRAIEALHVREPAGVSQRMSELTGLTIEVLGRGIIGVVEVNNFARSDVMIMSIAHMLKRVGNSRHAKLQRQNNEHDEEKKATHR